MKQKCKIIFLFLVLSVCALFFACSKEEEVAENMPPWTLEKYSFSGMARENYLFEDEIAIISIGGQPEYEAYEDYIVFCTKHWSIETGEVSEGEIIVLEDLLLRETNENGETIKFRNIYDFDYTGEKIYALTSWISYDRETQLAEYIDTTLKEFDREGNLLAVRDLSHLQIVEDGHYCFEVREDGGVYLFAENEKGYTLYLLNTDGSEEKITDIGMNPENEPEKRCIENTLYFINDGQVFFINDENQVEKIEAIEDATSLVGENKEIGIDFAYFTEVAIYGYSFETGKSELLLNRDQVNYEGYIGLFQNVYIESHDSIWGITSRYNSNEDLLGHMYPTPDVGDISDRTVIKYVKLDPYQFSIQNEIAEFNASNSEYYIEVVDLSGEEDPLGTLNNRIAGGESFDFVELSTLDYTALAKKGVLEDLNPYIQNSDTIRPEDLEETFLDVLEMDEALYEVTPFCYFYTMCADPVYLEQVGVANAENGWSTEDYIAYMQAVSPQVSGVQLLGAAITLDLSSFMDYSTGTCDFTNEKFYELLEACNKGQNIDMAENYEYVSDLNSFQENHILVLTLTPYHICEVQNYIRRSQDMALIGYPSEDGSGRAILSPALSFGMFSQSQYKEVVWDFLEVFLSYDYQKKYEVNLGAIATRKDVVDEMFAMMSEKEDFANTYFYGQNRILGEDFGTTVVEPLEASEVAQMEALLYGTTTRRTMNLTVYDIIMEESTAYFLGQKSAEDVAEIIENRVEIYLEE